MVADVALMAAEAIADGGFGLVGGDGGWGFWSEVGRGDEWIVKVMRVSVSVWAWEWESEKFFRVNEWERMRGVVFWGREMRAWLRGISAEWINEWENPPSEWIVSCFYFLIFLSFSFSGTRGRQVVSSGMVSGMWD